MMDLGTLYPECISNVTGSTAYGGNSKTQVVGSSWCDNVAAAAFLWEKGGPMVDLNSLITPSSDMRLVFGLTINGNGEITGVGFLPNGNARDFLLMPCDDDHPIAEGCDYSTVDTSAVVTASTGTSFSSSNDPAGSSCNSMPQLFSEEQLDGVWHSSSCHEDHESFKST